MESAVQSLVSQGGRMSRRELSRLGSQVSPLAGRWEWWEAPVARWSDKPENPNYKIAFKVTKLMASKLEVTNDNVESSLKGLKDNIKKYHSEESLQQGLTTLFEERKLAPANSSGKISKETLKNIVREKN